MKNLDEISQSFRKRAYFRLVVSLKKSYKLKNSDCDALHNKIFSHFKPMKTWLILTWGGWKSKWGKEFFLSWGQQNFIQGQPAPHKYGTIPHQQSASCMYTTNAGMSLSTNTQNTTSISNTELTAVFSTSAVYSNFRKYAHPSFLP